MQDFDDAREPTGLTRAAFQEWLHEGRLDCDVAQQMLRFWLWARRGSHHDTVADLFDQLYMEYVETLSPEEQEQRRRRAREDDPAEVLAEGELPVTRIAELLQRAGYVPFDTAGMSDPEIARQLCEDILGEVAKVQAYLASWKGSVVIAEPERQGVSDEIADVCDAVVHPWPVIEKAPVAANEEGRFVKAFPLAFPMGMGDLKQPQLRDDYTATEWAQHKLRYWDGRFVSSSRGHRETWAIFDTMLLEHSRHRGHAYHKATDSHVLTRRGLRELVESREDLVRRDGGVRRGHPDDADVLEAPDHAARVDRAADVVVAAVDP